MSIKNFDFLENRKWHLGLGSENDIKKNLLLSKKHFFIIDNSKSKVRGGNFFKN